MITRSSKILRSGASILTLNPLEIPHAKYIYINFRMLLELICELISAGIIDVMNNDEDEDIGGGGVDPMSRS